MLRSRSYSTQAKDEALEPDYLLTTPWPSLLDLYLHAGPSRLRDTPPSPASPAHEPYTNGHATTNASASVPSLASMLRK